jgi:LppP/LprE lipoprotein
VVPVAILAGLVVIAGIVAGVLAATGGKSNHAGPTPSTSPSSSPSPTTSATTSPTTPPSSAPPTSAPPTSTAPALASLSQAESVVMDDGYTPYSDSASNWDPSAPINVILGTLSGSADGFNNWAFFFAGNTYIGHDTSDPSAQISVFGRTKNVITLSYQLFAPNDPLCCPTAPAQQVRYQYANGVLTPLDPIPSSSGSGNHR